jgi:ankyrin repeat protein
MSRREQKIFVSVTVLACLVLPCCFIVCTCIWWAFESRVCNLLSGMDQFDAARRGEVQQLRVVLSTSNVNNKDRHGWTVLHCGAANGQLDCVSLALELGADVNSRNHIGSTPLHNASSNNHVDVVRMLLDAGASINATHDFICTPLYNAMHNGHVEVWRLLVDRGARVLHDGNDTQSFPDVIETLIKSRSNCRTAAVIIIGIHKHHCTNINGNNDINVLKVISKHIWSTRMDDVWIGSSGNE